MARLKTDALSISKFQYIPGATMTLRRLLLPLIIVLMVGCSDESPAPPQVQPSPASFSGHVLAADTEYYIDGPQQSRSPDGTLKAGVKVRVIDDAGSYCRVQTEDGTLVFIATNAIPSLSASDSQAAPDSLLGDGGKPQGD